MTFSEADTRSKLIDPAIHARGWTEDLIRREETAGAVEIIGGKARKQAKGRCHGPRYMEAIWAKETELSGELLRRLFRPLAAIHRSP